MEGGAHEFVAKDIFLPCLLLKILTIGGGTSLKKVEIRKLNVLTEPGFWWQRYKTYMYKSLKEISKKTG
jgi:hypothetical protein